MENLSTEVSNMAADVEGMDFIPFFDQLMDILSTNPDLRNSSKGIFKHAAIGVSGIILGGVFGGPIGALAGGITGVILGFRWTHDYDSMINVLKNMSDSEKKRFVQKVKKLVGGIGIVIFIQNPTQRVLLLNMIKTLSKNPQGV